MTRDPIVNLPSFVPAGSGTGLDRPVVLAVIGHRSGRIVQNGSRDRRQVGSSGLVINEAVSSAATGAGRNVSRTVHDSSGCSSRIASSQKKSERNPPGPSGKAGRPGFLRFRSTHFPISFSHRVPAFGGG